MSEPKFVRLVDTLIDLNSVEAAWEGYYTPPDMDSPPSHVKGLWVQFKSHQNGFTRGVTLAQFEELAGLPK